MYKRVLTVQDISCLGQCSLTVALPILSACGMETCIIPSAVLSTHTGGFKNYTFRDLTEDIPKIREHWESENISFDAVYTGYLGSTKQIEYVEEIFGSLLKLNAKIFVDPAMADNGKLYVGFDDNFVREMAKLCGKADVIMPNITEACLMTGQEYKESYDKEYIIELFKKLNALGAECIVLTGVSYDEGSIGVAVYEKGEYLYYKHKKIAGGCHGTGDVFASAFVGAAMKGKSMIEAAKIAADYTLLCIENTVGDENHRYGVKFETALPELIKTL